MFYTKSKRALKKLQEKNQVSFLDFVSTNTKSKIAWEMINNGANINEVFQKMDFQLEDHLKTNKEYEVANSFTYTDNLEEKVVLQYDRTAWDSI